MKRKHIHLWKTAVAIWGAACFLCACNEPNMGQPVSFDACAPLPIGRASATAFAVGEYGYVLGGRTGEKDGYLNDFWQYDVHADAWTQLPDAPFVGRVNAVACTLGSQVYVGLGFCGRIYTDSCYLRDWWCYDVNTSTWTRKADFPTANTDRAVVYTVDNLVYVCYGSDGGFSPVICVYNPTSNEWTVLKEDHKRAPSVSGAIGASCQGRYFLGTGFRLTTTNAWYEFNPKTDKWTARKKMPDKGRMLAACISASNRIFVLGGRAWGGTLTHEHFYDELMEYNPANNQWLMRGHLPQGGCTNMVTFGINGKVFFGLGDNRAGEILNQIYCFEP